MNIKGFVSIYPMLSKVLLPYSVHLFCKEISVPDLLVVEPTGEKTYKQVKNLCKQVETSLRLLEESTQCMNCVDLCISLFKEAIFRI